MSEEVSAPPAEEGAPAWMATFADMMSLLLCFFVLLLSFANTDVIKFKAALGSIKDALGVPVPKAGDWAVRSNTMIEISPSESSPKIAIDVPVPQPDKSPEDKQLHDQVEKFISDRRLDGLVEAIPGERGVTIRVKGTLMFSAASDGLRMGSTPILEEIADLAAAYDYNVAVEGHTDDVPIQTDRFPSNWELSSARAVAGLRYLLETGKLDPGRASATGYADTRPVATGKSEQARALNRRLEFVFYRDEERSSGGNRNAQDRSFQKAADGAAGAFRP